MKLCLIGCGTHSGFFHGPSLKRYSQGHPDTVLAACCDINEGAATGYAQDNDFLASYTDYKTMLAMEKPDLVDIILPVHLTESVTLDVVNMGFPCLVEKPPAMDPEGVRRIIDAADNAKVQVRVAFNRRFIPLTQALINMLAGHPEDKIQFISYDMHRVHRGGEDFSTTALHGIDLVRFVAQADYADIRFVYNPIGSDTKNIHLHGAMANGIIASLNFLPDTGLAMERLCMHTARHSYFLDIPVLKEDKGILSVFENNKLFSRDSGDTPASGQDYGTLGGFYDEIASFIDLIRMGATDNVSNIRQSLQSVEIACCVRDQALHYSI